MLQRTSQAMPVLPRPLRLCPFPWRHPLHRGRLRWQWWLVAVRANRTGPPPAGSRRLQPAAPQHVSSSASQAPQRQTHRRGRRHASPRGLRRRARARRALPARRRAHVRARSRSRTSPGSARRPTARPPRPVSGRCCMGSSLPPAAAETPVQPPHVPSSPPHNQPHKSQPLPPLSSRQRRNWTTPLALCLPISMS